MYQARIVALQAAVREGTVYVGTHVRQQALARGLTLADIWAALLHGEPEIIEDYPRGDVRGPSCLIWCRSTSGRVLHVVISYPPEPFLITAYWPDSRSDEWNHDFRRRVT